MSLLTRRDFCLQLQTPKCAKLITFVVISVTRGDWGTAKHPQIRYFSNLVLLYGIIYLLTFILIYIYYLKFRKMKNYIIHRVSSYIQRDKSFLIVKTIFYKNFKIIALIGIDKCESYNKIKMR